MSWFTRAVSSVTTTSILGLLSLLSLLPSAQAQAPASNAAAISGQVSTSTGQPAVSAQVRVCPIVAQGAPCVPLATLFTNSALTVQTQNPLATDQFGNYKAFVAAGLYLVQVYISSQGPVYTYYVSAGTANNGSASSPPPYTIQFASPTTGQFASDPTIFINPSQHILETPELLVPGSGTGLIGITGATSGGTVSQTVSNTTAAWNFVWPAAAPTGAGTFCLTAPAGAGTPPTTITAWQTCVLSGSFLPLSGGTLTGALVGQAATFSAVNTTLNPASCGGADAPGWCAGTDLGGWVNSALASCANQCTVELPAGNFSYSTQIVLPQNLYGKLKLKGQPGSALTYTGTGDAIVTSPVYIGASNLTIEGFELFGTGASANGIHLYPTNRVTVQNMLIEGFSTGAGIVVEGTNSSNILNNLITNNLYGVQLLSTFCSGSSPYTCSPTNTGGTLYAANAVNIDHNQIADNLDWGVIFVDSPGSGDSGSLNGNVSWNDLELNGSAGSQYGALYSGKSVGLQIAHNYFEGSPREIVLGLYTGGAGDYYGTIGATVENNFFTTLPATPYNIELENAGRTTIIGNTEQGGAGVGSGNCFINANTGGESNTVLLPNSIVQSPPNGNRLCIAGVPAQTFAGANSYILFDPNYHASLAYGSFPITTGASETQAAVNVATNSACFATPANGGTQSTAASLMTQVYVQPGAGQFTIFHPTGHPNLLYDIWCTGVLN